MADVYEKIRSLPFPALAGALGISLERFKTRKAGSEWFGPCIIHQAQKNTTSFSYNADGRYQCFSCGAKGRGAIDLVKAVKGVGFQQAVELLNPQVLVQAETSHAREHVQQPQELLGNVELKPYTGSYEKFKVESEWLTKRIPDKAIQEKYGVFCYENKARKSAYSGRVMVPIRDQTGLLFGYLGRSVHENTEPKYLFPRDFPKNQFLFGVAELRQHLAGMSGSASSRYKEVYLLESPFAVMKFASLGLPACSPFGWSVSDEQYTILQGLTKGLILLPDRNKYKELLPHVGHLARHLWVRFPPLPDGIDDPEQFETAKEIVALVR